LPPQIADLIRRLKGASRALHLDESRRAICYAIVGGAPSANACSPICSMKGESTSDIFGSHETDLIIAPPPPT
jgi:hypothetical protein